LGRTVSVGCAGGLLGLSATAGAVSGRGVLLPLPALAAVALVWFWSFARPPFTAVADELADADWYPESFARSRNEGTAGSLAPILRGSLWMGLDDWFWL